MSIARRLTATSTTAWAGKTANPGEEMTMAYRVSTSRIGERRWWREHEAIPATDTDVRPATPRETEIMDKIVHAKGAPSLALGKKIQLMLS